MSFKKYYLVLLILSFLLFVANVQAADENCYHISFNDGEFSDINSVLEIDESNKIIYLENGNYSGLNNTNLILSGNTTLIGQDMNKTVLDAKLLTNIFTISNHSNVVLINLTFINGRANLGGAINNHGNLSLINCSFIQNKAYNTIYGSDTCGGAVYNDNFLLIDNCYFINNTAGSLFQRKAYGGAVYNVALLMVNNSYFTGNSISYWGIEDQNNLARKGGAIASLSNNTKISNSVFKNHSIFSTKISTDYIGPHILMSGEGGALFIEGNYNEILNCLFENNRADIGGAVSVLGNNNAVKNSTFLNNSAYIGGALSCFDYYTNNKYSLNFLYNNIYSNISIGNCYFGENYLIHSEYNVLSDYNYFTGGGAVFLKINNLSITNSNFSSNFLDNMNKYSRYKYGGAVFAIGDNSLFNYCIFNENIASTGGALFTRGVSSSIINSNFSNNIALMDEGGAIFHTAGDNLHVINSSFVNNRAKNDGGAIYSVTRLNYDDMEQLTNHYSLYSNDYFANNSAMYGGAVYDNGDYSTFYNSTFVNNSAVYGGASYNHGLGNSYFNVTFNNNIAKGGDYSNGGAIFNYGSLASFNFCEFVDNYADNMGGALYNSGHDVSTSNSTFSNNSAFKGGAIYVRGNGGKIENNILNFNFAVYGGAIYNEGLNVIVSFNNFTSNNANVTGGGVYNTKDNLVLFSNLMDDCHAKLSGFGYGDYIYTTATISYLIVSFVNNQTYTILNNAGYLFANVTDNMGNPVTGGNVTFILYDEKNDETIVLGVNRLWEGVAYVDWDDTYDYGKYLIMGSYIYATAPVFTKNAFVYSLLSSAMILTVDNDLDNIYSDNTLNYEIVLIDSNDEYIANAEIKIYQSRTYVDSIFTDGAGKVNVSVTNLFGTYKYLFVYNGDLTHSSVSKTLNFTVKYDPSEIQFNDVIFVSYYPIVLSKVNSTIPFEFSMQYNKSSPDNESVYEIYPLAQVSLSYFDLYRDDELLDIIDLYAKAYSIDPELDSKKIATSSSGNFILPICEKEPGIHVYRFEFKKSFVQNVYSDPLRNKFYGYFNAFNSSFIFIADNDNASTSTSLEVNGSGNISEVDFANYSIKLFDSNGDLLKDKLVKVYDWGVYLGEFVTSDSPVNFTFSNYFDVGEHLIEFVYGGDDYYLACYDAFFLNVFENPNKISARFVNKTSLAVVGAGNNFTASLVDVDANPLSDFSIDVVITKSNESTSKFNFTTDVNGDFTIPLDLGHGVFILNCTFEGNRFYKNVSSIFNLTVNKTSTLLFGVSSLDVVGENYYLNYVLVDDNYTILSNRKLVIDVYSNQFNVTYHVFTNETGASKLKITLPVGEYIVLAYFEGEKWYDESNVVLTNLTVYGDYSRLVVDSNIVIKHSGYYTVKLTDSSNVPLSGKKVLISVNGINYVRITDDNGLARLKINLNYGKYDISSYFKGDLDYKYDYVSSNLLVVDDDYKFPTTIGINKSLSFRANNQGFVSRLSDVSNNLLYNMSLTISINGKNYVGVTNNEGLVLWDLGLPVGSYDAKIVFGGSADFQESSSAFHLTIVPNNASTSILSAPTYSVFKGMGNYFDVTLKDKLDNPIKNQIISILVNGVTYTRVTNDLGVVSLKIDLNAGSYDIYSRFDGSDAYYYSESYSKIVVLNPISLKLTKINTNSSLSIIGKGKYTVSLTDQNNNPLANCNITIIANGVSYIRTTNASGIAGLNLNLNPGEYMIYSIFKGNDEYRYSNLIKTSLTVKSPINGLNLVKYYKNDSQFYASLTDFDGNPLVNADVLMNIHGVFYTRKTNDAGIVKLNINLNPGKYILTLYYPEFENIQSSFNITVLSTIIISDLYKVYKNASQYEIKLLNSTGCALSNSKLSININGVIYKRITDENGTAILNINLEKGRYIATVCDESNGLLMSSNVVVWNNKATFTVPKEVLITKDNDLFSVNLKDGNDPLVGEPVSFNLNGVNYTQYCDKNGNARVKINLTPGEHIIKSSYANMGELTLLAVK